MLLKEELKRYNRHIILPEIGIDGQEKLKNAKVLVIGAGGLGCPVLQYLAAAGVGNIGVCDFDFVDESNLQRQILFDTHDVGKSKAKVAVEKLKKQNHYVNFQVHNLMLTKHNAIELFKKYDVIVDGSDNFSTRFLVNDACVLTAKPLVFGAIYKFEGQISVFNYKNGPTYRCLVPEQPDSSEMPSCSQIGVLGVLPGIIGSYQANEVIKIITGVGDVMSGKLLMIDILKITHTSLTIKRNEAVANVTELSDYGSFCNDTVFEVDNISPKKLFSLLEKDEVYVVDIRNIDNYNAYHIKSTHIEIEELINNPEMLPGGKDVVIVCEKGINSAAIIEEIMNDVGSIHLYNLDGGIQAWINENFPILKTEND